jgi:hypothetical protein
MYTSTCRARTFDGGGDDIIGLFYQNILSNPQEYSFVITSVYVAGYSTGQANGNRVTEGRFDALFSLTVGTVVKPGGTQIENVLHALSSTANVLSHENPLIDPVLLTVPILVPASTLESTNAVIYREDYPPIYAVLPNAGAPGGIGRAIIIGNGVEPG